MGERRGDGGGVGGGFSGAWEVSKFEISGVGWGPGVGGAGQACDASLGAGALSHEGFGVTW